MLATKRGEGRFALEFFAGSDKGRNQKADLRLVRTHGEASWARTAEQAGPAGPALKTYLLSSGIPPQAVNAVASKVLKGVGPIARPRTTAPRARGAAGHLERLWGCIQILQREALVGVSTTGARSEFTAYSG